MKKTAINIQRKKYRNREEFEYRITIIPAADGLIVTLTELNYGKKIPSKTLS